MPLPLIQMFPAGFHAPLTCSANPVKMQNIVRILKEFFNKMRFGAAFIGTCVLLTVYSEPITAQIHNLRRQGQIAALYFLFWIKK